MGRIKKFVDRHRSAVIYGVLLLSIATLVLNFWKLPPPQIGSDKEVFKTVDALFTAVNSRSQKQLDDCDRRLIVFRESGKLPKKSADYLDSVIRQARSGQWEPAAKRLYEFMYGQQRR